MTFGEALDALKRNKSVARKGWNGKDMYLFLVYRQESITNLINGIYGDPTGEPLPVLDAIYMKTADNKLVPWIASQTDILAEDWVIV